MASSLETFARRIYSLEREVRARRGLPLAHTSLVDGYIEEYNEAGDVAQIIGRQYDGSHVAAPVVGPPPPRPSTPTVVATIEGLLVTWDGLWAAGPTTVAPMDFARVDVVVGPVGFDPIATPPQGAVLSPRGGQVLIGDLVAGQTYEVALVARAMTGKASLPSPTAPGVPDARPAGMSQAELDQINADLSANTTAITDVNARVDTVETTAGQAASDASAAQTTAGQAASDASAAQTAAGQASTDASTALTAANGKNKVVYSTGDAAGTTGFTDGDTWFRRDDNGLVIGQWEFVGGAWQSRTLASAVIANLDAAKLTTGILHADRVALNSLHGDKIVGDTIIGAKMKALAISARELAADSVIAEKIKAGEVQTPHLMTGAVTAGKIDTGAITGLLVTGAQIQTVDAAARGIKLDGATNTFRAYDSLGTLKFEVNGNSGDVLFRGKLQTATSGARIEVGKTSSDAGITVDELRLYSGNAAETKYGGVGRYSSSGIEHLRLEAPKIGTFTPARFLLTGGNAAGINNAYIFGDEINLNPASLSSTAVRIDGSLVADSLETFGNVDAKGELHADIYVGSTRMGRARIFCDPLDYWPIFSGLDSGGGHTQKVKLIGSAVQIRNSADSAYGRLVADTLDAVDYVETTNVRHRAGGNLTIGNSTGTVTLDPLSGTLWVKGMTNGRGRIGNDPGDIALAWQNSKLSVCGPGYDSAAITGTTGRPIWATAHSVPSDSRLKRGFRALGSAGGGEALAAVRAIPTWEYEYNETTKRRLGIKAQDALAAAPQILDNPEAAESDDPEDYLGISLGDWIGLVHAAVQDLSDEVDSLRAELATRPPTPVR